MDDKLDALNQLEDSLESYEKSFIKISKSNLDIMKDFYKDMNDMDREKSTNTINNNLESMRKSIKAEYKMYKKSRDNMSKEDMNRYHKRHSELVKMYKAQGKAYRKYVTDPTSKELKNMAKLEKNAKKLAKTTKSVKIDIHEKELLESVDKFAEKLEKLKDLAIFSKLRELGDMNINATTETIHTNRENREEIRKTAGLSPEETAKLTKLFRQYSKESGYKIDSSAYLSNAVTLAKKGYKDKRLTSMAKAKTEQEFSMGTDMDSYDNIFEYDNRFDDGSGKSQFRGIAGFIRKLSNDKSNYMTPELGLQSTNDMLPKILARANGDKDTTDRLVKEVLKTTTMTNDNWVSSDQLEGAMEFIDGARNLDENVMNSLSLLKINPTSFKQLSEAGKYSDAYIQLVKGVKENWSNMPKLQKKTLTDALGLDYDLFESMNKINVEDLLASGKSFDRNLEEFQNSTVDYISKSIDETRMGIIERLTKKFANSEAAQKLEDFEASTGLDRGDLLMAGSFLAPGLMKGIGKPLARGAGSLLGRTGVGSALATAGEGSMLKGLGSAVAGKGAGLLTSLGGGSLAVGGATVAGVAGTVAGLFSGIKDIADSSKVQDKDERDKMQRTGISKISMTALGAGIGTMIAPGIGTIIGGGIGGIASLFAGEKVGDIVHDVTDKAGSMFKSVTSSVGSWVSDRWQDTKNIVKGAGDLYDKYKETKKKLILGAVDFAGDKLFGLVGADWDKFRDESISKMKQVGESTKQFLHNTWENAKTSMSDTWEATKTKAGDTWEGIKSKAGSVWSWITGEGEKSNSATETRAKQVWDTFKIAGVGAWTSLIDPISEFFGKIGKGISDMATNFKKGFSNFISDIMDRGDKVSKKISDSSSHTNKWGNANIGNDDYDTKVHKGEYLVRGGIADAFRSSGIMSSERRPKKMFKDFTSSIKKPSTKAPNAMDMLYKDIDVAARPGGMYEIMNQKAKSKNRGYSGISKVNKDTSTTMNKGDAIVPANQTKDLENAINYSNANFYNNESNLTGDDAARANGSNVQSWFKDIVNSARDTLKYATPGSSNTTDTQSGDANSANAVSNLSDGDFLGKVAAKYEVSGGAEKSGYISSGRGDAGGKSYGLPQFPINNGTPQKFINWLKGKSEYAKLSSILSTSNLDATWKKAAQADANLFAKAQMAYSYVLDVAPAVSKIRSATGIDMNRSRALQEMIIARSQHTGPGKVLPLVSGLNSSASDSEIIAKAYKVTKNNLRTWWRSSPGSWRGMANRFENEEKDVRSYLGKPAVNYSYSQGTPWVPNDQIALIHKGEAIVPKEYNPYNQATAVPNIQGEVESSEQITNVVKWGIHRLERKLDEVITTIQRNGSSSTISRRTENVVNWNY